MKKWHLETAAIRSGYERTEQGEHSPAIFTTSSYVYDSAAQAAARFSGEEEGNIYSRFTNPTVNAFEKRLAEMEGAQAGVATASGMAAIMATCTALLEQGDRILSSHSLFGSTLVLFNQYLKKFGIATDYVPLADQNAWAKAIRPETKLLFLETPSNPLLELGDIQFLADLAHQNGSLLVVDNCFCTPILQQPLQWGADIVIHSTTKYIDGQGRCLGGAVLGDQKTVGESVFGVIRTAGASMSPFNAWVFLNGLETLSLRMQAHSKQAQILAEWLAQHPAVKKVHYPGLSVHPQYELAKNQMLSGGGMVSFEIKGGKKEAWQLIDQTEILSITANLGDTKSTITHPASTTHGRLSPEQRQQAGISDALIRISVGLENIEDIQSDLERGLSLL